jgi:hypothetical protein
MAATRTLVPGLGAEVRSYLRDTGAEVGNRGRLSADAFSAYFRAKPKRAREVAALVGVKVTKGQRISQAALADIVTAVR